MVATDGSVPGGAPAARWAPRRSASKTGVGRDPVQPGTRARLTPAVSPGPPGRREHLLDVVLGHLQGSEHPVAVRMQLVRASRTMSSKSSSWPLTVRLLSVGRQPRPILSRPLAYWARTPVWLVGDGTDES